MARNATRHALPLLPLVLALIGMPAAHGWPAAAATTFGADTPPVAPAALSAPANAVVPASSAGYLEGSGSVGPDGSYNYAIPVDVPAGRAGMQPGLALRYSSRDGDGPQGMGWSLSGLSRISRCPSTLATEGKVAGVTMGPADRFCVDGAKLVSLTAGHYGENGTEYRTETDQFAKVVSVLDAGSSVSDGPDRFVVYLKDGRIRTYGVHGGTQVISGVGFSPAASQATLSTVTRKAVWLLEKEADCNGNEVRYEYANPSSGGNESLPRSITYTWHTGEPAKAAQRTVEFKYDQDIEPSPELQQRPDRSFSYQAGVRYNLSQRLREIHLRAPNLSGVPALAWKYILSYSLSNSGHSMLRSVAKCSPSGGCLRAKKFDYLDPDYLPFFGSVPLGTQVVSPSGDDPMLRVADLDGNGADDVVYTPGGAAPAVHVRLGSRSVLTGAVSPLANHQLEWPGTTGSALPAKTNVAASRPVDVEADGAAELMTRHVDSAGKGHDTLLRWDTANNKFALPATPVVFDASASTDFADLDGDGRLDRLTADVPQDPVTLACTTWCYSVRLGNGTGFGAAKPSKVSTGLNPRTTDTDGDGRGELVLQPCPGYICSGPSYALRLGGNGQPEQVAVSTVSNGVTYYTAAAYVPGYRTLYGDFNGDGLADVLLARTDFTKPKPRDFYLLWNAGTGLVLDGNMLGFAYDHTYPDLRIADINNDGRDDVVSLHTASTVYLSRGNGTFAWGDIDGFTGTIDPEVGRSTTQLGDFTGDGRLDVVRIVGNQLNLLVQEERYTDRLVQVSDEGTNWYRERLDYSTSWNDYAERLGENPCSYPLSCPRRGIVVVRRVSSKAHFADGGSTTPRRTLYSYDSPVVDQQGRGFLGFGLVRSWDPQVPAETTVKYGNRYAVDGTFYPGAYLPDEVTTVVPILTQAQVDGKPGGATARVTRTRHSWELNRPYTGSDRAIYQVFADREVDTRVWDQGVSINWSESLVGAPSDSHLTGIVEGAPARRSHVVTVHDKYGNATDVTAKTLTPAGAQARTVTGFADIEARKASWLISLPTAITDIRTEPGKAAVERHVGLHHDGLGRLDTKWVEKDNPSPDVRSTTTYGYDSLGVLRTTALATPGLPDRVSHLEYAPLPAGWPAGADEEIYPVQAWSEHAPAAYRPSTWMITHPGLGVTVASQDANGVITGTRIDDLGRPVETIPTGGAASQISYANRPDATGGTNGTTITTVRNHVTSNVNADALGRTLTSNVTGFDGTPTGSRTSYDQLGRVVRTIVPAPGGTTRYDYDSLGRRVTTTLPDGGTVGYGYPDMFTTVVTDPAGRQSVTVLDGANRVTSTTGKLVKPNGTVEDVTTSYGYAPFDLLATATDDGGHVTSMGYDLLGRQTSLSEPDRGTTTMTYYGTGEVHTTTRPSAGTTTFGYDDLGRQTSAANTVDGTRSFVFDTAAHGIGKLASATSPDGPTTSYRYDTAGRLAGVDLTDASVWPATMSVDYHVDGAGQPSYTEYPDPDGPGPASRFAVSYGYLLPDNTTHGYPVKISTSTAGFTPAPVWTVQSRKPNQALDTAVLGSGPGAVTVKRSYQAGSARLQGLSATVGGLTLQSLTYGYTASGQVNSRTQSDAGTGGATRTESFGYDTIGRLTGWGLTSGQAPIKSTSYSYDNAGNLRFAGADERAFGNQDGTLPHALTWHDGTAAGLETFDYDGAGRQTAVRAESGAATRQVSYNSFDLPRTVTSNGSTTTFGYDAFGNKTREVTRNSAGAVTGASYYLLGLYEKRITPAGVTQVYHLTGTDGPIGQAVTTNNGASYTMQYTLPDHLGSTSAVVSAAGQLTQALFYDPWGRRTDAAGAPFTGGTGGVTRGFTGHEHEDALGLINMRGRYYDPALDTFLTPDPLNTPAGNPYAYTDNDPLNHTDPTGYRPCDDGVLKGPHEYDGDECNNLSGTGVRIASGGGIVPFTALGPSPDTHGAPAVSDDTGYHSALEITGELGDGLDEIADSYGWRDEDGTPTAVDYDAGDDLDWEAANATLVELNPLDTFDPWEPAEAAELAGSPAAVGRSDLTAAADLSGTYSEKVPGLPGYHDVVVHSDGTTFGASPSAWKKHLDYSPAKLGEKIRASGTWDGGPIRLISCNSGAPGKNAAQGLADALGVPVLAPTSTVWIYQDGRMAVGPLWNYSLPPSEAWRVFHPRR